MGANQVKNKISFTKVFIDADAFVGLYVADDAHYKEAARIALILHEARVEVTTSFFVLGEAATVISQKAGIEYARKFLNSISFEEMTVFDLNYEIFMKAREIFAGQTSKNFRFSDAVNIALIKEHGIDAVFSFDNHYKQNGISRAGIDG